MTLHGRRRIVEYMSRTRSNLRSSVAPPAAIEPDRLPDVGPAAGVPELDGEDDPYYYGWRWQTAPGDKLRQIPLTYQDLLSPEVGDFIAESTIHHKVTAEVFGILERRYAAEPSVAVWSDLKIAFRVPGLTTGPGPDVCVVEGVADRERDRRSFRYGQEPGEIVLTVEVVSKKSAPKDYRDILEIYRRLGVREYLAIRPTGPCSDGPFELRGWLRDPKSGRLEPIRSDPEGRLPLRTVGLFAGTGPEGWGLKIWDAATGKRLRTPAAAEAERALEAEERAERAERRAEQEAAARLKAEEQSRQAEEQSRQAEEQSQVMAAEIERLRARLHERE